MCLDFVYPIWEYGVALEWLHNIGVVTSVWGIFKFVGDRNNVDMNQLNELEQRLKDGLHDQVVRLILASVI